MSSYAMFLPPDVKLRTTSLFMDLTYSAKFREDLSTKSTALGSSKKHLPTKYTINKIKTRLRINLILT